MGLPHSEIHGSTIARISPWLIAACYVLHRLLPPRHPLNALVTLDLLVVEADRDPKTATYVYVVVKCAGLGDQHALAQFRTQSRSSRTDLATGPKTQALRA